MKIYRTLLIGILVLGAAFSSKAQTATANASATIVVPLQITKAADLQFGAIVGGATGGTVQISAAGVRTTSLVTASGTYGAASFSVSGTGTSSFSVTLPSSNVTLSDGAGHTMTVNAFTSTPSGTGSLTAGAATINVGATLTVGNSQAAGSYSGTFDVSIAYQ